MENELDLYDARVGVEAYSRIINENVVEKKTWPDMIMGTADLCLDLLDKPACSQNPYLGNLLVTTVVCVLFESRDLVAVLDHGREMVLLRKTKTELAKVISNIREEVDECYPERDDELTTEQWLQIRKEQAQKIDPETAVVTWWYAQTLDPYGVDPDLPEECYQVGREYFARASRSYIWVSFHDLPDMTRERLWERMKSGEAFLNERDELPF